PTGTGSRAVTFSVTTNTSIVARYGTVFLGGHRFTVTQNPTPCTYAIWTGTATWAGDGGSGGIDVTTQPGCGWWVTTHAPWVHLAKQTGSGVGGSGSATIWYTVDPNQDSASRTAIIGGTQFTFVATQDVNGTTGGNTSTGGGSGNPGGWGGWSDSS